VRDTGQDKRDVASRVGREWGSLWRSRWAKSAVRRFGFLLVSTLVSKIVSFQTSEFVPLVFLSHRSPIISRFGGSEFGRKCCGWARNLDDHELGRRTRNSTQSPEACNTLNLILVHGLYMMDMMKDSIMKFTNAPSTVNMPKLPISTPLTSAAKTFMLCLEHTGNCWPHHLSPI